MVAIIAPENAARRRPAAAGFTLVELLVVIGVIAVLVSILLPSLARAQEQARRTQCGSNLRQVATAVIMYEGQYRSLPGAVWPVALDPYAVDFPGQTPVLTAADADRTISNQRFLAPFLGNSRDVWVCPSAREMRETATPISGTYAGKVVGYGYKVNNQSTNRPAYNFGYWGTTTVAANKKPKRINQVYGASVSSVDVKLPVTEIWMLSDVDSRILPTSATATFGLVDDSTTAPFEGRIWNTSHAGGKNAGRNYVFFDSHVEYRSLSDNVVDP
ncbi:MAG: prepilin-type N-terminal cleavage/methylation domain [Phycisphaerales bacterium]|nr:prepilin-type N-terminal cleavage/methylation domain [Phycisphaerales bacterium]